MVDENHAGVDLVGHFYAAFDIPSEYRSAKAEG